MLKKYTKLAIFIIILIVAFVTRFYKLGLMPEGLYVDEAGQGYSAYSIFKTGKDEFGKAFPVVFRSLTDFKTPIYIYLVTPIIPIFGLTSFTVRFPSFFFSMLTFPILFLLVKHLSKSNLLALTSCALLAISPWHILFGRTNFECNVALFFYLSGLLAFYKGLERPKLLIISSIMFGLAIPAYHSQRIITPLTLIYLFFSFKKVLFDKTHIKFSLTAAMLGILISLPTLSIATTPGFLARASGLNIFSHARQMPEGFISSYSGVLSPIINGSWFLSTREFFSLYFSYFSPRQMFILGDYGPRSSFPELSTFFIWQMPFYLLGLWMLFRGNLEKQFRAFIILTLLISPIPAAVTRDPYTTIRALPLVIPQTILIAIGLKYLYEKLNTKIQKSFYIIAFIFLAIYSILKLYSSVIILNEYYRAKYWDWGWQEVTTTLNNLNDNLPIVIDNGRSDPDLIIAFFLAYDPERYQKENKEIEISEYYTNLNRAKEKYVGNITIRPINWIKDTRIPQYIVGDELAVSTDQIKNHKLILINEILYPDGTVAYRIVKTTTN